MVEPATRPLHDGPPNGAPADRTPADGWTRRPRRLARTEPVADPAATATPFGNGPAVTGHERERPRRPDRRRPSDRLHAPQLRRFIKSRPYVPMHELRRRFAIDGGDDDVTPVHLDADCIFVGLPEREGRLLGELLRGGEIGYELSLDPRPPIVVGVYPMRPVPRT